MLAEFLNDADVHRVSRCLDMLSACGFRGALTGNLALKMRLLASGRPVERTTLNDIDLVVETFEAVPTSTVDHFLVNHVHPHAPPGKLLLQFVHRDTALRLDVFRQSGKTLSRCHPISTGSHPIHVVSVEDLAARLVSIALGGFRTGQPTDPKYLSRLRDALAVSNDAWLETAWGEQRKEEGTFAEALARIDELVAARPDLIAPDVYSTEAQDCAKCEDTPHFARASPAIIVDVLGYV